MKKLLIIIVLIAIIGIIGYQKGWFSGLSPASLNSADTAVFSSSDSSFSLNYPKEFKVTETDLTEAEGEQAGKTILVEGSEAKKGFEIVVLPFDEVGSLTSERILQDLPDMIINNEKNIKVGEGIDALQFESVDESLGPTYEIWFVYDGNLYEARTYPEFGAQMAEILGTFK